MSIINWIAIVLAVVLWMYQLNIGVGIAMSSSVPRIKKGSRLEFYLDRAEHIRGVAFFGSILTFITQLIDSPVVKNIGLIILVVSLLSIPILWSRLLRAYSLMPNETEDDQ